MLIIISFSHVHLLDMHSKLLFIYLHVIVFKTKAALGKDKMSTCLEYHMTERQNITPLQTTCAPGEEGVTLENGGTVLLE